MKKEYLKEIKSSLKEQMKLMHFKIKGQNFIRVVNNQIYQVVNFQGSASGNKFTVNIGIFPIFTNEGSLINPFLRIGDFISGIDVWYDYSEDSVHEVVDVISNKVLPVLDSLTTYEKLYFDVESELDNKLNSVDNVRNYKFAIINTSGMINLFWLCFKNNRYDKCKQILELEKENIKNWLDRCLEVQDEFKKNTASERFIKKIEENKSKLVSLAQERTKFVDNLYMLLENNDIKKLTSIIDEIQFNNLKKFKKFCF